jgi:hypothetical protein
LRVLVDCPDKRGGVQAHRQHAGGLQILQTQPAAECPALLQRPHVMPAIHHQNTGSPINNSISKLARACSLRYSCAFVVG